MAAPGCHYCSLTVGWGVQDGMTPLHWAAYNGHTAIVEALVTAGAEMNVTDKVGTSLHPAPTSLIVSTVGAGCAATGRRRSSSVTRLP